MHILKVDLVPQPGYFIIVKIKNWEFTVGLNIDNFVSIQIFLSNHYCTGDKNISILFLSCRTSDLKFSLFLQTHALVL